jgi:prolyl-tRNA synthetase
MRLSRYFLPVAEGNPSEAQIVSHRLMLRAGMIKQAQRRGSIPGCRWASRC